jgi:hypothetical protein
VKYALAAILLLLLTACDAYVHVTGKVVDAETGLPLDTFRVYEVSKAHPDTTGYLGHLYIPKDSGKYEASKITGGLKPDWLQLVFVAKGYEVIHTPDLKGGELTIKLKRKTND